MQNYPYFHLLLFAILPISQDEDWTFPPCPSPNFISIDRKSTRLNSSHQIISYAVFCLKKKKHPQAPRSNRSACRRTSREQRRARGHLPPRLLALARFGPVSARPHDREVFFFLKGVGPSDLPPLPPPALP